MMLTLATLGIFAYGVYSVAWAVVDVIRGARLEIWADLGLMLFGLLLALSAAFVRVRLPGGLAFTVGAMLGLQALAVHNAVHLETGLSPQIGRAILSATLVALAAASDPPDHADTASRDCSR
jgi:fatty acid desaturase